MNCRKYLQLQQQFSGVCLPQVCWKMGWCLFLYLYIIVILAWICMQLLVLPHFHFACNNQMLAMYLIRQCFIHSYQPVVYQSSYHFMFACRNCFSVVGCPNIIYLRTGRSNCPSHEWHRFLSLLVLFVLKLVLEGNTVFLQASVLFLSVLEDIGAIFLKKAHLEFNLKNRHL